MSFIASTRLKKLKKLFIIGRAIISQWGWGYFFYIVKLEYKKQKLSVFKPDQKPIPLFHRDSFQVDYENYLSFVEDKFSKELSENKSYQTKITFFLFYDASQLNHLQKTLKSFLDQTYNNWNLVLLPNDKSKLIDIKQIPQNDNISLLSTCDNDTILNKINELKSDFVGFIDFHVVLPSYSLTQFVKFLNNVTDSDIFYSDHDRIDENKKRYDPFFKPDWSSTTFYSFDFVSPLCLIKKSLVEKTLKTNTLDDYFSFDLLLYCIDLTKKISHIPFPLCSIIDTDISFDNESKKNLLIKHISQNNIAAKIENGLLPNTFRVHYDLKSQPKVSIFIPTKNNRPILKRCIDSIEKNTNYKNIEIIIIDNPESSIYFDPTLQEYYDKIPYKVITFDENFNFSKMNNLAVKESTGDLLLFLNDDTKILDKYWLDEMVSILLQDDVGVVGPKLVFGDDTLQHAGIVFLKTGSGFHPFMKLDENADGYYNFANIIKECSAVTGACLLTKKDIFETIGQFDEDFDVYYGDSDLCLKIRHAGYKIVYTPFTKLLHDGSFTLRSSGASYFAVESHQRFLEKWPELKNADPFFHPALDWDYSISNIK
jgi:GT2 family glycosyltransferase